MSAESKLISEEVKKDAERKKKIEGLMPKILPDTFLGWHSFPDHMELCLKNPEFEEEMDLHRWGPDIERMREENFQLFSDYYRNNPRVKLLKYQLNSHAIYDDKYRKFSIIDGWYWKSELPNANRFQTIASLFSSLPNLVHFNLEESGVCNQQYRKCFLGPCFTSILLNNIRFQNLTIFEITMGFPHKSKDKHINALCGFVKAHKKLKKVKFRFGFLKPKHFKLLEEAIKSVPSISTIEWNQWLADDPNTDKYVNTLQNVAQNNSEAQKLEERLSFVMGLHNRLGAESAVRSIKNDPTFSRDAIRMIFQFAGSASKSTIIRKDDPEASEATHKEVVQELGAEVDPETVANEKLLQAYNTYNGIK